MDGTLLGPESSPEAFLDQDTKGRFILNQRGEAILFDRTALALVGGDPEKLLGERFDPAEAGPLLREEGRTSDAVLYRARDPRTYRSAESGIRNLEDEATRLSRAASKASAASERLRSLLHVAEASTDQRAFLGAAHIVGRELFPRGGRLVAKAGTLSWGSESALGEETNVAAGTTLRVSDLDASLVEGVLGAYCAIVALGLGA
ncbi:MAG: hypothetical protein JST30_09395 [Armatimonadetes bacterium]|nr:hypothetical protein [Armatimonadota bacterium]